MLKHLWLAPFGLAFLIAACNTNQDGPTAPSLFEMESLPTDDSTSADPEPGDTAPSREARGELVITDNYGHCYQRTRYPYDYLGVFRVLESRAQVRIELYKNAEGALPCGFEIQVDCTVREKDPNARPKSGNLYDHFIGTLECPTPPPPGCKGKECDPPPPECEDNPSTEEDECCEGEGCDNDPCGNSFLTTENLGGGFYKVCSSSTFIVVVSDESEDRPAGCFTFELPELECDERIEWSIENACGDFLSGTLHGEECPPPPECDEVPIGYIGDGNLTCPFFVGGDYISNGKDDDESAPWDVPSGSDFYIVKCGNQIETWATIPDGEFCEQIENQNGQPQEISHVDSCVCVALN